MTLTRSLRWISSTMPLITLPRVIIDAACYSAFKRKSAEEANQLIEELAKCNYRTPLEASGSNGRYRAGGVP